MSSRTLPFRQLSTRSTKKSVFDPQVLHQCAKRAVGLKGDAMFEAALQAVDEAYPGIIEVKAPEWIVNNAGGAMGQMHIVYASLTEYIMLFGTPIGTEGHSGRYPVQIWDFMLDGAMWCYTEGETERHEYLPGDAAFLGRTSIKGYRVPDYGWMLEYGRGIIPAMLPFGIADALSSTLEWGNIGRTMKIYSSHLLRTYSRQLAGKGLPTTVRSSLPNTHAAGSTTAGTGTTATKQTRDSSKASSILSAT